MLFVLMGEVESTGARVWPPGSVTAQPLLAVCL